MTNTDSKKRRKRVTAAVAMVLILALLGGTFAWNLSLIHICAAVPRQAPGNGLIYTDRPLYCCAEVKGRSAHDSRGLFINYNFTDPDDRFTQGIDNLVVAACVVFFFPAGQLLIAYRRCV